MSKKPTLSPDAPIPPGTTFEAAQAELESLIATIETGECGLEESMAAYQRGLSLLRHCKSILDAAEVKFTDLTDQFKKEAGEGRST